MQRVFMLLGVLSIQLMHTECFGDIAIFAGYESTNVSSSDALPYPLADSYNLYEAGAYQINMPSQEEGIVNCIAINSFDGTVLYAGFSQERSVGFIYKGSVISNQVLPIIIPGDARVLITCVAIGPDGTAIFGGFSFENFPVIYRLSPGAMEVTQIGFPDSDSVIFNAIAIDSNGRAILVGQGVGDRPAIYSLASGESEVTSIPPPNSNSGFLNCIAIGPDGTAIMGGYDISNNAALIYTIPINSFLVNLITTPNSNDFSIIYDVATGPDGAAILVGSSAELTTYPLIYRLVLGDSLASIVLNPNSDIGAINSVAIGTDGTAIMGGVSRNSPNVPLIYRLFSRDEQASIVGLPNSEAGYIISVAIGSQNVAILGGVYYDLNQILLFRVDADQGAATTVFVPSSGLEGEIDNVVIYSCSDALYDIKRLRPYHSWEKSEATAIFND